MSDILKKALERTEREKGGARIASEPLETAAASPPVEKPGPAPVFERKLEKSRFAAPVRPGSPAAKTRPRGESQTRTTAFDPELLDDFKILHDCRIHPAADQVKIFRTQMLHRLLGIEGNSVLITSPGPGTGKTINAINVAISIAQEVDRTVLLIDANLRHPTVHKYFGISEEKGLADFLLGKAHIPDLMINPGINKLTVLPGGRPLLTSSEMLGAAKMAELVNEMKHRYEDRILVFDGPDILTNADALVFSRLVDGIIMVVEAEKTTRQEVREAVERLSGTRLLGTILNKFRD
ncbi:MAG: polysaccharide biosynthesis tyrosine autokinase [Deltaproteobacteria bacterium]|nr:polysaccharide biosynthesis tyrosine autokinase [Deltaproteobacteria bacterium]